MVKQISDEEVCPDKRSGGGPPSHAMHEGTKVPTL